MNELPTERLLEAVIETARKAGDFACKNKHRRNEVAVMLSHDVKLKMDIETQQVAEEHVLSLFPDHTILGEEGQTETKPDTYEWVIDPIDGTINYSNDMVIWCTSIAVRLNGKTLAGCVYAPELNECYSASIDTPALCNGEPISPSTRDKLEESYILTGIERNINDHTDDRVIRFLHELSTKVHKVRICGSAALDICNIARGRGDGFLEPGLYLWDVAAAGLIAERAGAKTEILGERPNYGLGYLCTNGKIHDSFKAIYKNTYEK